MKSLFCSLILCATYFCHANITAGEKTEKSQSPNNANSNLFVETSQPNAPSTFLELYTLGLNKKQMNQTDEALQTFFAAYALQPTYAEPLFHAAVISRESGNVLLGYLLAKHALSLPYPADNSPVEHRIYDHALLIEFANCALLLDKFEEGLDACSKLLANPNLPSEYRPPLEANQALACTKLGIQQPATIPNLGQSVSVNSPPPQRVKYSEAPFDSRIHEHGYWIGADIMHEHKYDKSLAEGLVVFFKKEKAKSVVDFGCGPGDYVKMFREQKIRCEGYDGNPDSAKISGGIIQVIDLSQPFNLEKRFDWVLSIEVGEHLPKKYERIFVENLHKHNVKGIVLSWAVEGQGGFGHFNEQNNEYVKKMMAEYGYKNDLEAENNLRQCAQLPWFKNTLMVFRKK